MIDTLQSNINKLRERLGMRKRYRDLFATENGRRVLEHIMNNGVVSNLTVGHNATTEELIRADERRRFAMSIYRYAKCSDDSELYSQIEDLVQQQELLKSQMRKAQRDDSE